MRGGHWLYTCNLGWRSVWFHTLWHWRSNCTDKPAGRHFPDRQGLEGIGGNRDQRSGILPLDTLPHLTDHCDRSEALPAFQQVYQAFDAPA